METDWAVGEVPAALDNAGIAGNTLVIHHSINGSLTLRFLPLPFFFAPLSG
jgi:hypothetical protein